MALAVSGVTYQLNEVSLQAKPAAMLVASPKGTVPVLVLPDGSVIDESLDIMHWALAHNDPERWLPMDDAAAELLSVNDGAFKFHLDRMKYANRYADADPVLHRAAATTLLAKLEHRLCCSPYLFGTTARLVDVAIFPFVRQFANADTAAFISQSMPALQGWLARWEASALFQAVMAGRMQLSERSS
jgi:glutathione S-transferase